MAELELVVDGKVYGGWTGVSISRSIEQLADSFSLSFTERWLPNSEPLPIREGAACRVVYDGIPVIVGYVDDSNPGYDAESHSCSVEGRSKAADLVDCSAIHKSGSWKNQKLDAIVRDVCAPFGITSRVASGVDVGAPFASFAIQDGETGHECIERAARMRGVLVVSENTGNLAIVRAGIKRSTTRIQRGVNVLDASRRGSHRERFSEYTLKAQLASSDDFFGEAAAFIKAKQQDSGIKRYRPLVIQADTQGDSTALKARAQWEANHRLGRSQRLQYTVPGWADDEGLWQPNVLVPVVDPYLAIDGEFLILGTKMSLDDQGTKTTLELGAPEAVSIEPPKPVKRGTGFVL